MNDAFWFLIGTVSGSILAVSGVFVGYYFSNQWIRNREGLSNIFDGREVLPEDTAGEEE